MGTGSILYDIDGFMKLPDKECCLVCLIIAILNVSFTGALIYLIHNEDSSQSD